MDHCSSLESTVNRMLPAKEIGRDVAQTFSDLDLGIRIPLGHVSHAPHYPRHGGRFGGWLCGVKTSMDLGFKFLSMSSNKICAKPQVAFNETDDEGLSGNLVAKALDCSRGGSV